MSGVGLYVYDRRDLLLLTTLWTALNVHVYCLYIILTSAHYMYRRCTCLPNYYAQQHFRKPIIFKCLYLNVRTLRVQNSWSNVRQSKWSI